MPNICNYCGSDRAFCMKKFLLFFIFAAASLLVGLLAVRFLFGGDEDTWICVNDQWVRHGNPNNPMPQTGCGSGGEKQ